jgi:hypothetical protein
MESGPSDLSDHLHMSNKYKSLGQRWSKPIVFLWKEIFAHIVASFFEEMLHQSRDDRSNSNAWSHPVHIESLLIELYKRYQLEYLLKG